MAGRLVFGDGKSDATQAPGHCTPVRISTRSCSAVRESLERSQPMVSLPFGLLQSRSACTTSASVFEPSQRFVLLPLAAPQQSQSQSFAPRPHRSRAVLPCPVAAAFLLITGQHEPASALSITRSSGGDRKASSSCPRARSSGALPSLQPGPSLFCLAAWYYS